MVPEKPASGVIKQSDFGDAKFYYVHCDCGNDECAHQLEVEADDFCVQVSIYHTVHTRWWNKSRWAQIWQILTTGRAEMQTTLVLDEQAALNYADVLVCAMDDVKEFRDNQK